MAVLSRNDSLDEQDVPDFHVGQEAVNLASIALDHVDRVDMESVVRDVESRLIRWALDRASGNLARAAELLGVPRSTLQYKVGKLEIAAK